MPRAGATQFKLQPADPFDLIRWLARSQSDPRKAIAELVQNSIDARATTVNVERRRLRGRPALVIRDDGEGVLPALGREEALRYLGTHIGHSHKLGLSPRERHERVIAGQYGVGLLGFWAIGAKLELRSRLAGSEVHVLSLEAERQTARLGRMPVELAAPPTFTELVIFEIHEAAMRSLGGRRLADYLAAELRGPILTAGASVEIHDHLARGLAQKRFPVTPKRYDGLPLDVPRELAVEGQPPIRLELYLSRGTERPAIQLACAGTLVADDISELDILGLARAPWTGRDVTGIIDFSGFRVPPGTRRGVLPDPAALACARALASIEPILTAELGRLDRKRRAEADRHVVGELRKALRGLHERMPHYDLPAIDHGTDAERGTRPGAPLPPPLIEDDVGPDDDAPPAQPELFAPGPLAAASLAKLVELTAGGERRIHARAVDADGRQIRDGLTFEWSIEGDGFAVAGDGPRPAVSAAGEVLVGAEACVRVVVRQATCSASASTRVVCTDARTRPERGGSGIPEPQLVDASGADWRSRMDGDVWQVNAGHEDYLALEDGRARIRYLVALFGKEIVARTYAQPGAGDLLEHLVAVIAHAERNLRSSRDA
ncbi:MAG: ATP-binding protein [Kofleriaceae bacterium]